MNLSLYKLWPRLEKLAKDKPTSLFGFFVSDIETSIISFPLDKEPGHNENAFQPCLIFVNKFRAYLSEAPFRFSTLGEASNLTHKH
jgi:hypothetical protein